MSAESLSRFILLPELHLIQTKSWGAQGYYWCVKESTTEYCPRCAAPSDRVHDLRRVAIKDAPIRGHGILLYITKRRLWCVPCRLNSRSLASTRRPSLNFRPGEISNFQVFPLSRDFQELSNSGSSFPFRIRAHLP